MGAEGGREARGDVRVLDELESQVTDLQGQLTDLQGQLNELEVSHALQGLLDQQVQEQDILGMAMAV